MCLIFLYGEQKLTKGKSRVISDIYARSGLVETKSEQKGGSPLFYVINFEDEQGYAIVSGDTRMQPIIAVTEKGSLKQGEDESDPSVLMILSMAETDYRMAVGLPIRDINDVYYAPISINEDGSYEYAKLSDNEVIGEIDTTSLAGKLIYSSWSGYKKFGNVLDCSWGQSCSPYNTYTYTSEGVKAPAGCVATAVAQILYFWGVNFKMDGVSFDWEVMRRHKSIEEPYSPAYEMIGKLYYELGLKKNLDMSYGENGSGANSDNIYRTFINCGLTSGGKIEEYEWSKIVDAICDRPVYARGYSNCTVEVGEGGEEVVTRLYNGHAWVIDATMSRKRPMLKMNGKNYKVVGYQYERLAHCNFGWDGYRNGYYYSGKFDATNPPVKSTKEYGKRYFYQYGLDVNCRIVK